MEVSYLIHNAEEKKTCYATFFQRLLAHNIDLMPILFLLYLSTLIVPKTGFDWLIFTFIYLTYNTAFEMSYWNATPGKRWMNISVRPEKGQLTLRKSIARNALKGVSLLMCFGGFILILYNPQKQSFHDLMAKTLIIFNGDIK